MKITLETERLILRPFEYGDAEEMFRAWASDPDTTKYLTWNPHGSVEVSRYVIDQWIKEYEKPERRNFAITLKESGKLIGCIDVVGYLGGVSGTPVLGYVLGREYRNRGYMTEACRAVLDHLFKAGYPEVRIDAMQENEASQRVIQKCGGVFTGTEVQDRPLKNDAVTVNIYIVKNRS